VLVVLSISVPVVELLSFMSLLLVVLSISVPVVELLSFMSLVLVVLSIIVPVGSTTGTLMDRAISTGDLQGNLS
jgi:hypothetical protein